MKICIVGDVHWSRYSSIVRSRGKYFSTRLENLIKTLNWVEKTAKEYNCEKEIFLGDFFDRAELSDEEISSLPMIEWNDSAKKRYFIVGNHESGLSTLEFNSTSALSHIERNLVVNVPLFSPVDDKTELLFLPYITEDNRKPLKEYIEGRNQNKKLIICSHNDIKDFQMGRFLSVAGFSIGEIEKNCDLYINGHLHNGSWVTKNILNLGNITGQNFGEDASVYEHHIGILDTDTGEIEFVENPYALNFYKIDIEEEKDIDKLNKLKNNAVLSIRCEESLRDKVKETLETRDVVASKVIVFRKVADTQSGPSIADINTVDHLKKFADFILSKEWDDIGITKEELVEVCK